MKLLKAVFEFPQVLPTATIREDIRGSKRGVGQKEKGLFLRIVSVAFPPGVGSSVGG